MIIELHQFDDMWQRAVSSTLVLAKKPNDGCNKIDWRFDKEVPLLLDPVTVQTEHDSPGRFGCICDILHCGGIKRIAPVIDLVKIDYIKRRALWVIVPISAQGVICNA